MHSRSVVGDCFVPRNDDLFDITLNTAVVLNDFLLTTLTAGIIDICSKNTDEQ